MILLLPQRFSVIGLLSNVLEAASWRSNTVFTSFYLRDLQYVFEGVRSLGPSVATGERIG